MSAAVNQPVTLSVALLVALGGGLGAMAHALVIHHLALRRSDPLPLGTVVVNASGSLVLGLLTGFSLYHGLGPKEISVLGVGVCGGYTTWSTASWESLHLLRSGHRREAVLYSFGGLVACLAAAALGLAVAFVV